MLSRLSVCAGVLALAGGAAAQDSVEFVETFSDLENTGAWSWGTGNDVIETLNGNPGAFLADLTLVTCCPTLSTAFGDVSVFTGDYRARQVSEVGVDLITLDADVSVGSRPLSVILLNDNGTPSDLTDDWGAYFIGAKTIPERGVLGLRESSAGWTDFAFAIPSESAVLPEGWQVFTDFDDPRAPDQVWNDLIVDVTNLQFFYGDPASFFPFHGWDVGMDNPRITFVPLPGDVNGDGRLDIDDFRQIIGAFGPCEGCPEDLNGDGVVDRLDLTEFLRLLGRVPTN